MPPHCAQIQVGNFNQTIATLQLGGSETAIVVSIVICSVLLLLSVVGKSPAHEIVGGASVKPSESGSGQGVGTIRRWQISVSPSVIRP